MTSSGCEAGPRPAGSPILGRDAGAEAVTAWLDGCQAELLHPGLVEERLQRAGWVPAAASAVALRYRRRFAEHHLGYTALLVTTGLSALAAGSAGHVLVAGLSRPVNRGALSRWLTLLVCALPFAAWAHWWAAKVDRVDPVAVWSAPRRTLAKVLLWACGIVGIGRLVVYVGQLMRVLVAAGPPSTVGAASTGEPVYAATLNVMIVVGIALPLGLWAHRFLHRFDAEDPTRPLSPRRSPQA